MSTIIFVTGTSLEKHSGHGKVPVEKDEIPLDELVPVMIIFL